jgi:hypothetical protein
LHLFDLALLQTLPGEIRGVCAEAQVRSSNEFPDHDVRTQLAAPHVGKILAPCARGSAGVPPATFSNRATQRRSIPPQQHSAKNDSQPLDKSPESAILSWYIFVSSFEHHQTGSRRFLNFRPAHKPFIYNGLRTPENSMFPKQLILNALRTLWKNTGGGSRYFPTSKLFPASPERRRLPIVENRA